jgi:hypothetical protein
MSPVHNTSIHSTLQSSQINKIPRPGSSQAYNNPLQMQPVVSDKRDSRSKISDQTKKNKEF